MQLVYTGAAGGLNLFFPVNAAEVTEEIRPVVNQSGRPIRYVLTMHCKCILDALGQLNCSAAEALAKRVLTAPYGSLSLLMDNGFPSAASLINNQTVSGVTIVDGPHFRNAMGPEWVTMRTVEFTMQAEVLNPGQANALVSFKQTVTKQGTGGPDRFWDFPCNGYPAIRQQLTSTSLVVTTQAGTIVNHTGPNPDPPPPLWPDYLVPRACSVSYDTPEPKGPLNWLNWATHYQYQFHSPFLLYGTTPLPTV